MGGGFDRERCMAGRSGSRTSTGSERGADSGFGVGRVWASMAGRAWASAGGDDDGHGGRGDVCSEFHSLGLGCSEIGSLPRQRQLDNGNGDTYD
uniref:Uncharacterized protein n=1 Tax=Oryza sativa subsp. japonica TaxID=39947 RepID=Q6EQU7_ORYSJ|nr:hypothetical protein [Oryza sativa Japonica Group]